METEVPTVVNNPEGGCAINSNAVLTTLASLPTPQGTALLTPLARAHSKMHSALANLHRTRAIPNRGDSMRSRAADINTDRLAFDEAVETAALSNLSARQSLAKLCLVVSGSPSRNML